ncbi:MAG: excinuclease subunit [Patescibacteria group bacterium]|nr:excinuclease subunit [Patescibacteria group bacterium]
MKQPSVISIKGARVHNLKNVSLDLPKGAFIVMTGLSGSGKSSLAFDTIHAEGQRRYMESLSSYARQFMEMQDKPDVDEITGLSPTVAIDQKTSSHNPRSTVGTVTEIYDFLRVLYARAGCASCTGCGAVLRPQSPEGIAEHLMSWAKREPVQLLAPLVKEQKGEHKLVFASLESSGIQEARVDGVLIDREEVMHTRLDKQVAHSIEALVCVIEEAGLAQKLVLTKVQRGLELGKGMVLAVGIKTGEERALSASLHCSACDRSFPSLEPRLFSFNAPQGACSACTGLGTKLVLEPSLVIPNKRLTIAQGAIKPLTRIAGNQTTTLRLLAAVGEVHGFTLDTPIAEFTKPQLRALFEGTGDVAYAVDQKTCIFSGLIAFLEEKHKETDSEYVQKELEGYMRVLTCPACQGKRLRPEALAVRVAGISIGELVSRPLEELPALFATFEREAGHGALKTSVKKSSKAIQEPVQLPCADDEAHRLVIQQTAKEVTRRVQHLLDVGLSYLTLDRAAMSLSGGEAQRVRLAAQLGSDLSGLIYILDEPSIGLHQRDNERLIQTIKRLRDQGNTVIVVEHDQAVMEAADYLVDIGPGAGEYGGRIMAAGTLNEIKKNPDSPTAPYIFGRKAIATPATRRKGNGKTLTVKDATAFHLKNVTASIPLGTFTCVAGVSGSGKSTLILDILGRALNNHFYGSKDPVGAHGSIEGIQYIDKVVSVDQSPIGRTPRSNPATYTNVFTAIRDLFTEIPEAKARGFDAGKFSFNVKGGGRCEACSGDGAIQISMQFLPDIYVDCPECRGKRYNAEALEVSWHGKTIADVLDMTVEEAKRFFAEEPAIHDKLAVLHEVGLGYIRLGQSATTLSGGEAQRVKLATELARRSTGKTLYILDEPTTGLHFEDIQRLLVVIQALVDRGNTVLVIEHNLDVLRTADWILEIGPEGGAKGGVLVAEGTPEQLAKRKTVTAEYLREELKKHPPKKAKETKKG